VGWVVVPAAEPHAASAVTACCSCTCLPPTLLRFEATGPLGDLAAAPFFGATPPFEELDAAFEDDVAASGLLARTGDASGVLDFGMSVEVSKSSVTVGKDGSSAKPDASCRMKGAMASHACSCGLLAEFVTGDNLAKRFSLCSRFCS